ncbi:hypothetical protein D9M71_677540 [compost metagenome]
MPDENDSQREPIGLGLSVVVPGKNLAQGRLGEHLIRDPKPANDFVVRKYFSFCLDNLWRAADNPCARSQGGDRA